MKVAVVGAGFAGLSCAFFLLEKGCDVAVFDASGIGGGASGVAAGLLHPYVGEEGRRSQEATEALREANSLMQRAQEHLGQRVAVPGLIRSVPKEKQGVFEGHQERYGDVQRVGPSEFLIESGKTVDCALYLEGLWGLIEKRGGAFEQKRIADIQELEAFDGVVIAAGAGTVGIRGVPPLKVSLLKGQVLRCRDESSCLPEHSLVAKGYVAHLGGKECVVGSTYERHFQDALPDEKLCQEFVYPKVAAFFPQVKELKVLECRSGVRVCRQGHYFPLLEKVSERVWILTALGSRGLLYHALLGKRLSGLIHY